MHRFLHDRRLGRRPPGSRSGTYIPAIATEGDIRTQAAPRAALLTIGLALLAISTIAFFRVPVLPSIGDELDLGPVALGGVTILFALGRLAVDIPAGLLADRLSPVAAYALAGTAMCAGTGLVAGAGEPTVLWLGAFVIGVASSTANTMGMTFFSRSVPAAARGRSLAFFSSGLLVGQTLGPAIGGPIGAATDWRIAMAIGSAAALAIAATFALIALRRPPALGLILAPESPRTRTPPAGEGSAAAPVATATALPRRQLAVVFLCAFAVFFTLAALPQTLVPLIGDGLGLNAAEIGLLLGVGGASRLVGAAVGGIAADRRGRKWALVPGLSLMAVGVAALAVNDDVAGLAIAIVLTSLGSIGVSIGATIIGDRTPGGRTGRLFGRYRFVGDLGFLVGPLVATVLFEQVGLDAPLVVNALLLAGCALAAASSVDETLERD